VKLFHRRYQFFFFTTKTLYNSKLEAEEKVENKELKIIVHKGGRFFNFFKHVEISIKRCVSNRWKPYICEFYDFSQIVWFKAIFWYYLFLNSVFLDEKFDINRDFFNIFCSRLRYWFDLHKKSKFWIRKKCSKTF